jgi:hypothetical protein
MAWPDARSRGRCQSAPFASGLTLPRARASMLAWRGAGGLIEFILLALLDLALALGFLGGCALRRAIALPLEPAAH